MARILIVDDDPTNRLLLMTILEFGGYDLNEAANGAEALLAARRQPPDLIIMDLNMPGMSVTDFLRALREEPDLARVRVALHTATSTTPDLVQFMESVGVETAIPKPSDPQQLLDRVKTLLAP